MTQQPPQPDRPMRQVLAELELVSHGKSARYNGAGGGGDADRDPRPHGELHPPHDTYRRAWMGARDDAQRAEVLEHARQELAAIRVRQDRELHEETAEQFDARAREKLDAGWTVEQVAQSMRANPTRIRRIAAQQPAPAAAGVSAQQLAEQGYSVRGIAMRLGISRSEAHRRLKRAA